MFCCAPSAKRLEVKDEVVEDSVPDVNISAQQQSMHDYIFSPKDFCESVHQKKLIPEYYLKGIDPTIDNADPASKRNSLRLSQGEGSETPTNRRSSNLIVVLPQNDVVEADQAIRRSSSFNRSQGDVTPKRHSAVLRASQGDAGDADPTLRRSSSFKSTNSDHSESNTNANGTTGTDSVPTTPRTQGKRFSTFFSNTSYTNINYYEEFCELFPHFAIVPTDGFRVELGGRVTAGQELFLQEQDAYNLAYQRIFQKNDHNNFVGGDAINPFIVSILACDDVEGGCRTIVRTKHRDHHIIVPNQSSPIKMAKYALAQCRKSDSSIPENPKFTPIKGTFIVKDLTNFEDKTYKSKHKMGILYCKRGQTTEEEMFCNTDPSPEFTEFLDMIAEKVTLRGYPATKFAGGLDTKNDMMGSESYYTTFENLEMMFHVSTCLPYTPDRPVQVERKKHIGNDVVCIVFMDSPIPFRPNTITSKFIHVIIVVQFLERNNKNNPVYRVSVASKPGVEPHHPILPTPPHFEGGEDFRKFILTKAINAERAAAHAPSFKLTRTRMNGLATIVEKHMEEAPPKSCFG